MPEGASFVQIGLTLLKTAFNPPLMGGGGIYKSDPHKRTPDSDSTSK